MFYRKYRPQTFKDLIGIENIKTTITKQIVDNKFAHAYLLIGPRGTGKTTLARLFAKAVNCTSLGKDGEPCNKCDTCVGVNNGSLIDLIEIDAASNRGIDDIRDLREGVKLSPSTAKYKVYIIDEVHMLTKEAFNALLKTLEEPPEHSIFILATTDPHKIPETVKSRCQTLELSRAKVDDLVKVLESIAKSEKHKIDKKDLIRIAIASKGGFRDAVTMLEQVVTSGLGVESVVNSTSEVDFSRLMQNLIDGNSTDAISFINDLYEKGVDLQVFTAGFVFYIRDILLTQVGQVDLVLDTTTENIKKLQDFASKLTQTHIIKLIDTFTKAQLNFRNAVTPQLPLEIAVLELLAKPSEEVKKKPEGVGDESSADADKPIPLVGDDGNDKEIDSSGLPAYAGKPQNDGGVILNTRIQGEGSTSSSPSASRSKDFEGDWKIVVSEIAKINSSLSAILKSSKPAQINDKTLTLEVYYSFHKERIEAIRNKELIQDILGKTYGITKIECVIGVKSQSKIVDKRRDPKVDTDAGDLVDSNLANVEIDIDDLAKLLEE